MAGGIPGSHGPETLAAVVDHQVHALHHGVSLDFKHAFDTVDLGLMHLALQQSVPECMVGWLNLVFKQWMCMSRWIQYDGCVAPGRPCLPFDHECADVTKLVTTLRYSM